MSGVAPQPTGVLDCGKTPCPEHGQRCSFHGTEPDRCPWCHSTWGRILDTGHHSCEAAGVWRNGRQSDNADYVAERVAQAVALRQRAPERPHGPWQGGFCSHRYSDTPRPVGGCAAAQNSSEEVAR
jgi:hypothetical protein